MNLPVTFDDPGVVYGLLGFQGAEESSIVADPAGGTNQVAKVVKSAMAQTFAGTTLTAPAGLGFASKVPFTASNTRMTVRIYSADTGVNVRLKVEDHADPTASVETEALTTKASQWETVTFDFANQAVGTAELNLAKTFDKATLFFNFGVSGADAGAAKTYYFDDVTFLPGTTPVPTDGPPAPTVAQANVISLYSDSYTNVPVDTFGTSWSNYNGGPNLKEVTLSGNNKANQYKQLVFAGIEFIGAAGAKEIDATTMTHFHVDVWTGNATVFKVKLVDFGNDKNSGGGDDSEHELAFDATSTPPLVTGQWVSLELPLASFTGLTARAHLAQIVISSDKGTVYLDNIYFHK